jgi:outer membrane protein TolC
LTFFTVGAQEVGAKLSLDEAIVTALEHSYHLKIAKNQLSQAKNNNTAGNAGLLPSVSVNGGVEYSKSDAEFQFMGVNSNVIKVDGAKSESYNGNVRIDYTLFDGLGNVYTLQKLKQSEEMEQFRFNQQLENTIVDVVDKYYQVCSAQQKVNLARESMNISKDRYQKTKDKRHYGQATRLDVLNAEVDLNNDSTSLLMAEQLFITTQKNLNVALGIPVNSIYEVDEIVEFTSKFSADEVMALALENNSTLKTQQQMKRISDLDVKITKAQKFPSLTAYGMYGYNRQDNDAGQLLYSQNNGVSGGLSLRFNVYNGRRQNVREKNAKLSQLSQQEYTRQLIAMMERDASNAYTDFVYKKRIVDLQQTSLVQAELNFEQTKEMFQLGRIGSIEFRTAQQNLLNVAINYNEARYKAKVAEYNLLRITGVLLKENN